MAFFTPQTLHYLRLSLRQRPHQLRRSFCRSHAHKKNGALVTFPTTSSSELDAHLDHIRSTIFIPSHLLRPQQALVYRKSLHHYLTGEEPVTATLPTTAGTEETVTLNPLDRLLAPSTKQIYTTFLSLLRTKADWLLLPSFLEGMATARRPLKGPVAEKMVRRAAAEGHMGQVMDVLRRTGRTGVRLDTTGVAQRVMLAWLGRAIEYKWEKGSVEKTGRETMQTLEMVDGPAHTAKHGSARKENPRFAPDVVGVPLGLAALSLIRFGGGEARAVEMLAGRVLGLVSRKELAQVDEKWQVANWQMVAWAPAWWGMRMAAKALGEESDVGKALLKRSRNDVEPFVEKLRIKLGEAPEGHVTEGLKLYTDLAASLG